MRRSTFRLCSRIDLDGNPSRYFPRFRPRRLVMPVDPSDVHGSKRQPNQMIEAVKAQTRRRRQAEKRGAVQLSTVPAERSVGDAFRLMLDACTAQQLFSEAALTPRTVRDLAALVEEHKKAKKAADKERSGDASTTAHVTEERAVDAVEESTAVVSSPLYTVAFEHTAASAAAPQRGDHQNPNSSSSSLSVREVDMLWEMLDHTPLNAPVHGALALRGAAVVRTTLLELAYEAYPRLRSKHVQQLLHETTGLLPCGRIAMRVGFADHCGVEGDIAMWRELNTLSERLRIARKQATAHLQRMEKGVAAQRRWYWRAVLRSASGRLKLFPVHKEDLQPRLEWVRSSLFAFIAFVEVAEQSGDVQARVRPLVHHLFASQLARHVRRCRVLDAAAAAVEATHLTATTTTAATDATNAAAADVLAERVAVELRRVKARTADEEEVLEGRTHPMNRRADRKRDQFESSGGAHGTQALVNEELERHGEAHARLAPPLLLHALEATTTNAFKEAQLILRYAPEVSPELRHAPIDVDQSVRRVVELQETNNYASLHTAQQYRQVEYTMCRLYAGRHCLGEGKGETLMSAMQDASMEMLFRYYLAAPTSKGSPIEASTAAASAEGHVEQREGGIPAARIRPPRSEEEIVL